MKSLSSTVFKHVDRLCKHNKITIVSIAFIKPDVHISVHVTKYLRDFDIPTKRTSVCQGIFSFWM